MEPSVERLKYFQATRRVVVKLGSGLLTRDNGLNLTVIRAISRQICELMESGREVIIVSSGAMAAGIRKLMLEKRPDDIPKRQAVAAVGQSGLMLAYEKAFSRHDRKVAQILLTGDGLANRDMYLNARNTLNTLLAWQVVPIINENDTVAVQEIQFGDNDHLSAMISLLMDAGILINLTDIDGLYTMDPRRRPHEAQLITTVERINRKIEGYAGDIAGALGTGGMLSKIKAARKVTMAGIPMVIARGARKNILTELFEGKPLGTFFIPREQKLASRKCWIAFSLKPKGNIRVDDGAAEAVLNNGKSLLPSGVIAVEGEFPKGAAVGVVSANDREMGVGLVNYSANEIRIIMGLKSGQIRKRLGYKPYDEVIHRDNLAITMVADI